MTTSNNQPSKDSVLNAARKQFPDQHIRLEPIVEIDNSIKNYTLAVRSAHLPSTIKLEDRGILKWKDVKSGSLSEILTFLQENKK